MTAWKPQTPIIYSVLIVLTIHCKARSQQSCQTAYANIIGSYVDSEKGYSVAAWPPEDVIYLGGFRNDSVLLLRVKSSGELEWARTFNFNSSQGDHLHGFIVDSEGMIVGLGGTEIPQSGSEPFAFRYNPYTHEMLWAKEYRTAFEYLTNGIHEVFSNGDFLMVNNPHNGSLNDAELIRLERNTGNVVSTLARHIDLGGSESLGDVVSHEGFLYAAGRYTDGAPNSRMRTTITKIDPQDGRPVWTRLGHISSSATGRLYGVDMVIDQDHIYALSLGNPTGTNLNASQVFVQKFDVDGQLVWIRRYDLPGTTDWLDEIIQVGDGFIVMGRNRMPPSNIYIFKIDHDGNRIWSKQFDFSDNDNSVMIGGVQSQMIRLNNSIFFTAEAENNGNSDLILVRTNMQGEISETCVETSDIDINVYPVSNPVFYAVQPSLRSITPQVISLPLQSGKAVVLNTTAICRTQDTLISEIEEVICEGEEIEGYHQTGQYIDHFTTANGCDSMRVLNLAVHPNAFSAIDTTICKGQSFESYSVTGMYVDTFTSATGCDSIRTLQLNVLEPIITTWTISICPDSLFEGYGATGTYMDTFASASGCDSIRTLNLTVMQMDVTELFIDICNGQIFEGYGSTGIYTDTFISSAGCDSIRVLHLEVVSQLYSSIDVLICPGDTYEGYSSGGVYVDTLVSVFGCDSIRELTLQVNQPELHLDIQLCAGQSFEGYDGPGTYIDTFMAVPGACDTIRYLNLSFIPPPYTLLEASICEGQQYEGYSLTGVYTDTLQTETGCDSVRSLQLSVQPMPAAEITVPLCEGLSFGYPRPGTYRDTILASTGCDTVRTIHVEGSVWYIPNVFSPNDDQVNDVFEILAVPDQDIGLSYFAIFDRFGDMVYETRSWPVRWDGRHRASGRYYNPGVFAYVLILDCQAQPYEEHGDITLLR